MLNWLKSFGSVIFGGLNDLKNWIINLFSTVFSYIDSWAKDIWNGITEVWNFAASLYNKAIGYIVELYNLARYIIDVEIKTVEQWVTSLWGELKSGITNLANWALGLINKLGSWVLSQLNSLYRWVLRNIWDPLYNGITGAINWISKYGYWAYYMVTHPDVLASFIGSYILREFFSLGRKFATSIARWLVHSMISAGHEIGDLIAEAIAAIL